MAAALPSIGPTQPPPGEPPAELRPFVIGSANDPTGVMGRRLGAFALDGLLSLLLTLLAVLAGGGFVEQRGAIDCTQFSGTVCLSWGDSVYTTRTAATWAIVVAPLLYALIFSIIGQGLTGATPGKALFGLRVVDAEGVGPGPGRAAARTVLLLVDVLPCCLPLVGVITASTSRGHRRVGDMAATTFVIDRRDTGRSIVMASMPPTTTALGPHLTSPPPVAPVPVPPRPQWDPARNAYVLWDPARSRWLAFDQATGLWREI